MQKLKLLTILFCLLSLVACMQQPTPVCTLPVETRQQILSDMQSWQLKGKLGIREKHSGHNISIEWRQRPNKYSLYLYSPLATESATINGKAGEVSLTTGDRETYGSSSAEQLVREHLGWDLPVADLAYWIKGMPSPNGVNVMHFDQYNQLKTLQQNGWSIEYQSYHAIVPVTLPAKMSLSDGKITLKVIISEWKK